MIDSARIEDLSRRIRDAFHPERIILFGSYAHGTPTDDSDVDILVILPFEGSPIRKSVEILNQTNPEFSVDLLARTPEYVQQRLALGDFFIQDILEQGRVLYEAAHV